MKVQMITFTRNGSKTAVKIMEFMKEQGHSCRAYSKGSFSPEGAFIQLNDSLSHWTRERFQESDALIFIGATGIAVRAIAPYIKSKTEDPAVLVVDEQGKFVIPILSGHIGGANQLARSMACGLSAEAVITTATDLNGKLAVDQWAKEQNLHIADMKAAKQVAADLLQNKLVGFFSDLPFCGQFPSELCHERRQSNILINIRNEQIQNGDLLLTPRTVILGIGCRRGVAENVIAQAVDKAIDDAGISHHAVKKVTSIDLKRDEPGLIAFCRSRQLEFQVYSAEELNAVKGDYTKSEFVKSVTGVDSVCERAAVLGSSGGHLVIKKHAGNGVTVAAALENKILTFI